MMKYHESRREAVRGLLAILLLVGSMTSGWAEARAVSQGVRLLLNTEALEPTTTFEVRFDEPVIASEVVGLTAPEAPIVIEPALAGQFVWLSPRSGVFTPTAPPALGQIYRFRLRSGLRTPEGTPVQARLLQQLSTPPFGITALSPPSSRFNTNDAPSEPTIQLQFNADVSAEGARPFVCFINAQGARVEAEVRQALQNDYFEMTAPVDSLSSDREGVSSLTWKERFESAHATPVGAPSVVELRLERNSARRNLPQPHRLVVQPAWPLAPGAHWSLKVSPGLPSTEPNLRTSADYTVPIGTVLPFTVTAIDPESGLHSGRQIRVRFAKPLSSELSVSNLTQWISVEPNPPGLKAVPEYHLLRVFGNYDLDKHYTITIKAGLPAADPLALAQTVVGTVKFAPLSPRLYFPAFATDQLSQGQRRFELLTLNVPHVQLRAKRFDRHNVIDALRGYRSYYQADGPLPTGEMYRAIDYNVLPGRTVFQTNLAVAPKLDATQTLQLSWDDLVGPGAKGVVFLAAESHVGDPAGPKVVGTQALVQLTDWGLVWKRAGPEYWFWLFAYSSGQPIAHARLGLMTDENQLLAETETDEHGWTHCPSPAAVPWLIAEKGEDLIALQLGSGTQEVPLYQFQVPTRWSDDPLPVYTLLLFSDRPLYRPRETVHLKSLVRCRKSAGLEIPTPFTAWFKGIDARGEVFLETNVTFSAMGAADLALALPQRPLGQYRVEVTLGANGQHLAAHDFRVAEFQPSAFEVQVQSKASYGPGEAVTLPVTARYYSGARLSKARLRWLVDAMDFGFSPEGYDDFLFTARGDYGQSAEEQSAMTLSGEVTYAGAEDFGLSPQIPMNPRHPQPRWVEMLVDVTDLNQQTVSRNVGFTRHSSDFYLGLKPFKDVVRAGESPPLQVVAVNADGSPHNAPVRVQARLQRIEWHNVRVQGPGRTLQYRNEMEVHLVQELELTTSPLARQDSHWRIRPGPETTPGADDQDQRGRPRLTLPQAGDYRLEVSAQDEAGRPVVTRVRFSVYGRDQLAWEYRDESRLELAPDQPVYQPGQTATILVKAPFSGSALVTIERDRVLRSFVTQLEGNAPSLAIPLAESDQPNVFVSVLLLRGFEQSPRRVPMPEYRLGYCQINVESPATKLAVAVTPARPDYRPAQEVQLAVAVTDGTRQPAANAEVTLFAVDEGILSLGDYTRPDPHAFFYALEPLGVHFASTFPNLLPEDSGERRFSNKGYRLGAGGGREGYRHHFLACAFWNATLMTDAEGKATARFIAPDGLTRYRLLAVAHTARHQFGSGESAFRINKPLMIEPALPLVANVGDQLRARAVVMNQLDHAGEVVVTLELDQRAQPSGSAPVRAGEGETARLPAVVCTNSLRLARQSSGALEFPVTFTSPGTAEWIWRARFVDAGPEPFTDAVQSRMTVSRAAPWLQEVYAGRVDTVETNLLALVNPQMLEGHGTVTVRLANTRLAGLNSAVEHLLQYPYGCAEQTSSSLLPWLVLGDFAGVFPRLQVDPARSRETVQKGLERLWAMQTLYGGLAYWPGDIRPELWVSAYGGLVLTLAQRHGQRCPAESMKRLLNYLSESLRGSADLRDPVELSDRCWVLLTLAMAGRAEPAYHGVLYEKRGRLPVESRAVLALAMLEGQDASDKIEELLVAKEVLPVSPDPWFGCAARELALQLLAWCRHRPQDPQVDRLVQDLVRLQQNSHWTTTQGNAWTMWGLADYFRRVESATLSASGTLQWGPRTVAFALPEHPSVFETKLELTPETGRQPLLVLNPEARGLFTEVALAVQPRVTLLPRQDRGFSVARRYSILDENNEPQTWREPRVGDRVLVTLEFEAQRPAHYVAIDDPLPSILEAVPQSTSALRFKTGTGATDDWFSDFRELRQDRALFFRDHLGPGRYTIHYVTRVRAAGVSLAPGAKVEEMYHPDRLGLSETVTVSSRSWD